jgi:hypothetical protein
MQITYKVLPKISAKFLENKLCANFYRPNNLSTLITFDAGGVWSPIAGPTTDHDGHPILGCSQVSTLPAVFEVGVEDQYSDSDPQILKNPNLKMSRKRVPVLG